MKKIISLLLVVLPLLIMLSCDRDNIVTNQQISPTNKPSNEHFVVRFKIIQNCFSGGEQVLVDEVRNFGLEGLNTGNLSFNTLFCGGGCNYYAVCTFEWYNNEYNCYPAPWAYCDNMFASFAFSGSNETIIGSHCPPPDPLPPFGTIHYGPCTDQETITLTDLNLSQGQRYSYRLQAQYVMLDDLKKSK